MAAGMNELPAEGFSSPGLMADINAPGEAESYIVRSVAEFFKSGEYES